MDNYKNEIIEYYQIRYRNDTLLRVELLYIKNIKTLPTNYPKIGESVFIDNYIWNVVNIVKIENKIKIILNRGKNISFY